VMQPHDPLDSEYDLLEVEFDGEEVDAVPAELLRAHTAQLERVVEEPVHSVDLPDCQADVRFLHVFEGQLVQLLRVYGSVKDEVEGGVQVDLLVRVLRVVVEVAGGDCVQVE
jgi:hypothetical protein